VLVGAWLARLGETPSRFVGIVQWESVDNHATNFVLTGLSRARSVESTTSVQRQTKANSLRIFSSMPTKTRLRRRLIGVIAAVAVGLLGFAAPAYADTSPDISVTIGSTTVTPGQTVTVTVQFTNTQATDVNFIYQSLSADWTTTHQEPSAPDFSFQGCSGDDSYCDAAGQTIEWYDSPPIAPGASQTVTLSYLVAADSPCGGYNIAFNFYDYDEYNSDTNNEGALFGTSPFTTVNCS